MRDNGHTYLIRSALQKVALALQPNGLSPNGPVRKTKLVADRDRTNSSYDQQVANNDTHGQSQGGPAGR